MIELHSHCLPQVDDGPASESDALQLLRQYETQGVTDVICTSHIELDSLNNQQALAARLSHLQQKRQTMQACAQADGLKIKLHSGAELILCPDLPQRLRESGRELALAESTYLLVELPRWFSGGLKMLDSLLFAIQMTGFMPILAHPERSMGPSDVMLQLTEWVEKERLLLQVNASSLIIDCQWPSERAMRYKKRQTYLQQLLEKHLVSFVASDAHSPDSRPPYNQLAYETLRDQYGETKARLLMIENPRRVLQDEMIELTIDNSQQINLTSGR